MTLRRRLQRLERTAQDQGSRALEQRLDEEIEALRRNCDDAEVVSRFDRAEERMRLAMEEGVRLGSETDECGHAADEFLDALTELTTSAREFTEPQKRAEGGKLHGSVR